MTSAHSPGEPGVAVFRRAAFNPFSSADESGLVTPRARPQFDDGGAFTPRTWVCGGAGAGAGAGEGGLTVADSSRLPELASSGPMGTVPNGDGGGSAIVVAGVDSAVGMVQTRCRRTTTAAATVAPHLCATWEPPRAHADCCLTKTSCLLALCSTSSGC